MDSSRSMERKEKSQGFLLDIVQPNKQTTLLEFECIFNVFIMSQGHLGEGSKDGTILECIGIMLMV